MSCHLGLIDYLVIIYFLTAFILTECNKSPVNLVNLSIIGRKTLNCVYPLSYWVGRMDEVLDKFNSALHSEDSRSTGNSYECLYKNWGKPRTQEERRKEILAIQKEQRNNNLDSFRGILDYVQGNEEKDNTSIFKNKSVEYRPNIYVAGFHKTSPAYNNVLMLSEWLKERPWDFDRNWFVVAVPKGIRTLVVSAQGTTKFYSKNGHFLMECPTGLPAGNSTNFYRRKAKYCVLDGFYVENDNTLYILDLIAWNSQPMTDGETEFRQFWLKAQLEELTDINEVSQTNKVIFKLLKMISCAPDSFNRFMLKFPHFKNNSPTVDGLLFYHKQAHYFAGETPLVGWLYPYMVKEVLGNDIMVNYRYEEERPSDYTNQQDFVAKYEANNPKRKHRSTTMEIKSNRFKDFGLPTQSQRWDLEMRY